MVAIDMLIVNLFIGQDGKLFKVWKKFNVCQI